MTDTTKSFGIHVRARVGATSKALAESILFGPW